MYETFEQLEEALKDFSIEVENYDDVVDVHTTLFKFKVPNFSPIKRRTFKFKNNRYLSVIRGSGTYGYEEDLFEVAILTEDGKLDYTTSIADEVIGHCDIKRIIAIAKLVSDL